MLDISLVLLFGIIGAFWRAWFGGSFKDISRIWKILVMLIIYIMMFYMVYLK